MTDPKNEPEQATKVILLAAKALSPSGLDEADQRCRSAAA